MKFDVAIVGAGHAGAQAATALRQLKFDGSIALIGDEPEFPYERPPLSKEYFAGEKSFERILIRPRQFWDDRAIRVLTNTRIASIDPLAHAITSDADEQFEYGTLIWATGGTPRRLTIPGANLPGVLGLRTKADADAMISGASLASEVVVIGGGYIGLEAAAVLSKIGKKVTILEAQPRVLARVAGEELSRFFEAQHRSHGVDVRLGVTISQIIGETEVQGVQLGDGEILPAQLVIVGIGIEPAIAPLIAAGAQGTNGVEVDHQCRTSLPDVYAIGDCASHRNRYADGQIVRLESVQNANDMAMTVARSILGGEEGYDAVPWFWSNQYDLKLQTVGLNSNFDQTVIRGDPALRSFSCVYLRNGQIVALDCVNSTKDYVQGKALVASAASVSRELLADTNVALKDLLT